MTSRAEVPPAEAYLMVGHPMDWRRTHLTDDDLSQRLVGEHVTTLCGRSAMVRDRPPRNNHGTCKQCVSRLDATRAATDPASGRIGPVADGAST